MGRYCRVHFYRFVGKSLHKRINPYDRKSKTYKIVTVAEQYASATYNKEKSKNNIIHNYNIVIEFLLKNTSFYERFFLKETL